MGGENEKTSGQAPEVFVFVSGLSRGSGVAAAAVIFGVAFVTLVGAVAVAIRTVSGGFLLHRE